MYRRHSLLAACLVLAVALLTPPVSASDAATPALAERIEAYLRPAVERDFFSGYVLVARGDEVLYEGAFGLADRELGVPISPRTRFNVASVTKPMTMVAAIRMMEAGKLALGDRLSKFVPDFPRGDEITVEHLMRHRAGIPHRVTEPGDETAPVTAAEMVTLAREKPLLFAPGEQSVYSSAGFSVLARVLEIAGEASYQALLEKYLFEPAGMTRSAHVDSRTILPDRASAYGHSPAGIVNAPLQDLSFLVGAGSVYTTARDLFAMQRALLAGTLGEGAKLSLLRENGLAWNGSTSGFRAYADWHRDADLAVIVTANLQSGVNDLLRAALPRLVAGEAVEPIELPELRDVTIADETLRRYEGLYELRPGSEMRVRAQDGGLLVNEWLLVPTGETTFFSPQDFGEVEVVFNDDGTIEGLDWASPNGSVLMRRVGSL